MGYGDDVTPSGPPPVDGSIAGAPPPGLPWWASSPDMLQQLSASGFTPAQPQQPSMPAPMPPPVDSSIAGAPPPGLPDWIPPEAAAHYGLTPIDAPTKPALADPFPSSAGDMFDPIQHGIREAAHAAGLLADVPGAAIGALAQGGAQLRQRAQDDAVAASPLGQELDAYKQIGDVTKQIGDKDANQALDNQVILEDRNRRVAEQQAAIAAAEQARAANEAQLTKKYQDAIDAEAHFKVDPNRRWASLGTGGKIAAAISVALSGLGNAIAGKVDAPNAALKIIQDSIKEDVDQQYKDREDKQWQVGAARNSLDTYRQVAGDAIQGKRLKLAEEYRNAADQMEQTAQRYTSDRATLNAKIGAQQLRLQAQQLVSGAAAQQSAQEHARAVAVLEQFNKDQDRKVKQQEANTGSQNAYTAARGEKREELKDVTTANIDVAKLIQEGSKADAAAREQLLKGDDLAVSAEPILDDKGNITGYNKLRAMSKPDAERLLPIVSATRDATLKSYALREMIAKRGGQVFNSADAQRMKSLYQDIVADTMEARGYKRYSPDTAEAVKEALGDGDPTSIRRSIDAGLDQEIKGLNDHLANDLPGWVQPTDPSTAKPAAITQLLGPQTAREAGAAANPGVIGGLISDRDADRRFAQMLGHDATGTAAENTGNGVGLQPEAVEGMNKLVAAASGTGRDAAAAKATLLKTIASTDPHTAAVGNALLSELKSSNPALRKELVDTLPKEQRKARLDLDAASLSMTPASGLAAAVRAGGAGSVEAFQELHERAYIKKDPDAQRELSDLMTGRSWQSEPLNPTSWRDQ